MMSDTHSFQSASQGAGVGLPQNAGEEDQNIVEPQILAKQQGKGSKRGRAEREVLQAAYEALWDLGNGGFLTIGQQKAIWPYITWPPIPQWHMLQFDSKADLHSLTHIVEPDEHTVKQALAGVFQPNRRVHNGQLYYEHLLFPIFFSHQEDGMNVCMWGMVHVQKGENAAYFHVLAKWQEEIHGANIRAWAESFDLQGMFGCRFRLPRLKTVVQIHCAELNVQAFKEQYDIGTWSKLTFFYSIHVVRHLMLLGAGDGQIPRFDLDKHGPEGVVQLLVGISTAFEHAGLRMANVWPAYKMEESEDNRELYRKVCKEVRNAVEGDCTVESASSEFETSSESPGGSSITDDMSSGACTSWEMDQDDEMCFS